MNPENDPCDYGHHTTSPRHQPYDSDPEEVDIGFGPRAPGRNGYFPSGLIEREQPVEQNLGPRIVRTTLIHGIPGGGTRSITSHATRTDFPAGQTETLQDLSRNLLRNVGMPPPTNEIRDGTEGAGDAPAGPAQSLAVISNLLNLPNGTRGGAVYFLEVLNGIIRNRRDANAHSNAAPPATKEALKSLKRMPVDKDMLGSEATTGATATSLKGKIWGPSLISPAYWEYAVLPCSIYPSGELLVPLITPNHVKYDIREFQVRARAARIGLCEIF
ncbi:hypothetical protein FANTH_9774 [Fusarium anthophilum]|uniref:Uncharacterized protein n=1 Tax=Fusarium anthophilum TaxID=48485 RepID=A0A8H4Z5A1_9HYPO|nr:hypothetical protein FANTH_9774 [Fusarium anthophilum]